MRSHNTTQASIGAIIGLCKIAKAATEVGYHDAHSGETIDKTASYTPSMTIGSVNVSPLTMANIYATYAANGVACTPIAMTKVTKDDGTELEVPKANCHQAVDPEIIQTLAYTLNQGVTRPDGAGGSAQLDNGRKTFAKTGTNGDTYVSTGGFIPNQIATFVLVGDVQNPNANRMANVAINGVYRTMWDGSMIAAPAWKAFNNAYAERKQLPIDNDYGQPSSKYTATSNTVTSIQGVTSTLQQRSSNSNSNSNNQQNNSNNQQNGNNTNNNNSNNNSNNH